MLTYITDGHRHLICVPYSIENLHQMASELGIDKCWFHKNHYDIPKKRREEIEKKCQKVRPRNIVEILRSPQYGETLLSEEIPLVGACRKDMFWKTQFEYHGV